MDADPETPALSRTLRRVETLRPLVQREDGLWTCKAYTASDYIEGFAVENVAPGAVEAILVRNNNGRFELRYQAGLRPAGRPYARASTWRATPAVFTPQASFVVELRRGTAIDAAKPPALLIYDLFVPPEIYDADHTRRLAGQPAWLGDGNYRLAAAPDGYDILDEHGVRVNQF